MKLRITGFGPFGDVAENPSGILAGELASDLGREFALLDVTFQAADRFVEEIQPGERILMLGVNAKAQGLVLETVAKNWCGANPDVSGEVRGPGPIEPKAPQQLGSTLFFREEAFLDDRWSLGVDAGDYLCNYLLFQALWKAPEALAGFVHVPPFEAVPRTDQAAALADLIQLLESDF